MYGIVTIVEDEWGDLVRKMWSDLKSSQGSEAVVGFSLPHFTYHVADDYDMATVERLLKKLASNTQEFSVPSGGLAMYPGDEGILYINMVRSPNLTRLQDALWDEATKAGTNVVRLYHRDRWLPHVTIANYRKAMNELPQLAATFETARVPRKIPVNNLAIIKEVSTGHEVCFRVELQNQV